MIPQAITEKITLEDGREIILETGKLAKQADGAVVVKLGGTMLLATVVANKEANPGVDFLPLTVDYREKFTSAGKVPGGFLKREGRPSDEEILTMRLVDRVLRPLFPDDFHAEVQIMISVISYDGGVMPDSLAGLAASAALAITDIPFNGPISEVRIIRKNGEFKINPSWKELQDGVELDMMVGGSKDSIVMIEGEMDEISEEEMVDAIAHAHEEIKKQVDAQGRLAEKIPLDKIVLETDSPYLAPVPFRGKRNSPEYLEFVVGKLSDLYGVSREFIIEVTHNNAQKLI